MDPELRETLEQIRRQAEVAATRTAEQFDELRAHVDTTAETLRAQLDTTAETLRAHVDTTAATLRTQLDASATETRRHSLVVAEDLRGEIRQVAEAVGALTERVDRLDVDLREEILRSQREVSAMIRFSYAELDRKIQTLEARVETFEARLRRLEAAR